MAIRLFSILTLTMIQLTICQAQNRYLDNIKAAQSGDVKAQVEIGHCYANGYGVDKDETQALFWYKKAAEKGYAVAQRILGDYYYDKSQLTEDQEQARKWYRLAADQGDMVAQYKFGNCCSEISERIDWVRKSAEQGFAEAQYEMGAQLFWDDVEKGISWYKMAADQNYLDANQFLGVIYMKGFKVPQNLDLALYYCTKARDLGSELAKEFVKEIKTMMKEQKHTPRISSDIDENIPSANSSDNLTFAVIIGNEKYKNETAVPFAEHDAEVFKSYAIKALGIPEKQIKYYTNATLNDLHVATRWLKQAMEVCAGQGKAIFYYAGHGIPDEADKTAYILPTDGSGRDAKSAYSLQELYSELNDMAAQRVTVFLDACFSGTKRDGDMLASARGVAIKIKPSIPQGNVIVFTAAQGDETAYPYEDKGHGMFTYYLLKKMQESRSEVTLGNLFDYLTLEVRKQSFLENGKIQTPTVLSSGALADTWRTMKLK